MEIEEYISSIGVKETGFMSEDGSYVIDIIDSNRYGKIFSILDKSDDLDILEDNQVITEQGSSIMYESLSEPYLLNLIADFDGDVYQLIVTKID